MFEGLRVDEVGEARKVKNGLIAIEPFQKCLINVTNAKKYTKVLAENEMMYYFDENAKDVVLYSHDLDGKEYQKTFTSKQIKALDFIRDRFAEDEEVYLSMFDNVIPLYTECEEESLSFENII